MSVNPTREEILSALNLRLSCRGDSVTIKEYFHRLLNTLWDEGEEFSGKRPFGDSCWQSAIYWPLAKAGLISATFDGGDDDDPDDQIMWLEDKAAAKAYVAKLIDAVFQESKGG